MKAFSRRLAPFLPLLLLAVALWILHGELGPHHYRQALAYLGQVPAARLVLALALTVASYAVLTGYDWLGSRLAAAPLGYPRVALASFISYAFSNTMGHALLTSTPLRFRLYGAWGASAEQITRIVAFCFLTFWVGFAALAGVVFSVFPGELPVTLRLPFGGERPLGIALLAAIAAYLAATALRRRSFRVRSWEVRLPPLRFALGQILVAGADWALAAAVLYALLPPAPGLGYSGLLAAFLLAQIAGVLSQVPGGLGVFETVMVLTLGATLGEGTVLGALLLYRLLYYLGPLLVAALVLAVMELGRQRAHLERALGAASELAASVVPQALALSTFAAGTLLLLTGATPARTSRLAWLNDLLPLPVIEASHFLASLAGGLLLVLARGLQRRLDAAYQGVLLLLAGGIAFALLRGIDWPTALTLTLMFALLAPLRGSFYRKASLGEMRLTPGWVAGILVVLGATLWLTTFPQRLPGTADQLWWSFALSGDAPRSLRAFVAVAGLLLLVGAVKVMRPAPPEPDPPEPEELERAAVVVAASSRASTAIALLGDKRLLFSPQGDAFIAFAVEGRSWVALGDPVGPEPAADELAWRFREMAERHADWPVFYQVTERGLPRYVDMGLALLKIGEEGKIPLAGFNLEGSARKELRQVVRRMEEKEGASFEVLGAERVPELLPRMRQISDAWLADKSAGEKGFSLGFFEPRYLARFPVAVVRRGGEIVAFANVLATGGREELTVDLMRYLPDTPPGVMTYLFTRLMLWGAAEGYGRFSMGMAPLAGLEERVGAPLWNRVAGLVYRHGEHFYNFQGLRLYKEKFAPQWEDRYLACPGGLALPRVLGNLTTLISGGVTEVFRR